MSVLTLINRGTGEARSFHVDRVDGQTVLPIVRANIAKETAIVTDEAAHYRDLKRTHYHASVNHQAKEWAARRVAHQHGRELFQRVQARHEGRLSALLREALAPLPCRVRLPLFSNRSGLGVDDAKRTDRALRGIEGKRLTYRRIGRARSETGSEA